MSGKGKSPHCSWYRKILRSAGENVGKVVLVLDRYIVGSPPPFQGFLRSQVELLVQLPEFTLDLQVRTHSKQKQTGKKFSRLAIIRVLKIDILWFCFARFVTVFVCFQQSFESCLHHSAADVDVDTESVSYYDICGLALAICSCIGMIFVCIYQ